MTARAHTEYRAAKTQSGLETPPAASSASSASGSAGTTPPSRPAGAPRTLPPSYPQNGSKKYLPDGSVRLQLPQHAASNNNGSFPTTSSRSSQSGESAAAAEGASSGAATATGSGSAASLGTPQTFKLKLCRNFLSGMTCPFGDRCVFAHGDDTARVLAARSTTRGVPPGHGGSNDAPLPMPPTQHDRSFETGPSLEVPYSSAGVGSSQEAASGAVTRGAPPPPYAPPAYEDFAASQQQAPQPLFTPPPAYAHPPSPSRGGHHNHNHHYHNHRGSAVGVSVHAAPFVPAANTTTAANERMPYSTSVSLNVSGAFEMSGRVASGPLGHLLEGSPLAVEMQLLPQRLTMDALTMSRSSTPAAAASNGLGHSQRVSSPHGPSSPTSRFRHDPYTPLGRTFASPTSPSAGTMTFPVIV